MKRKKRKKKKLPDGTGKSPALKEELDLRRTVCVRDVNVLRSG